MGTPAHQLFPSPLRYPGGKRKLANYIKLLFVENGLVGREYIEPYAGGASVALSLLFEEYASHVHINDLDRSVYTFWKVVLEDADELCRRIDSTRVTVAEWNRQHAIQGQADPDPIDLAFSTFFLNRTNRSGIIGGGIIGGRAQTGAWRIDARFNRTDLIGRIRRIARFKSRITLTQRDGAEYLREVGATFPDAFVYLDPPYYVKGGDLYANSYVHEDHEEVASCIRGLDAPWIVTYDAAPQIQAFYQGFSSLRYDLSYSAQARYRGREVMFFSGGLRRPRVPTPASVPSQRVDCARQDALGGS